MEEKKIKVYKQNQYLIFDFENGKTVKYDFATKKPIGKSGKPVNNLKHQLSGITIEQLVECCEDKNYAKFLKYVQKRASQTYNCRNIGTILSKIPRYSRFEQIFSAGIDDIIDINGENFRYTINDIPKALIKLCKNKKITLSNNLVEFYKLSPNENFIALTLDYTSLTSRDIYDILTGHKWNAGTSYFNDLIKTFGYKAKPLLLYIDELKTFEAIENINALMGELHDYARMMNFISPKFEKYPRRFLTTHRIASRNYNRLKQQFNEELFSKRINKGYEFTYKDYVFIYPNSTQDIKDEAVQQNNCVASYINRVINGECHIMFLRNKDYPDKSLVTLEIINNQIVQARQRFNDMVSKEQQEVIDIWNAKYKAIDKKIA